MQGRCKQQVVCVSSAAPSVVVQLVELLQQENGTEDASGTLIPSATSGQIVATLGDRALATPESTCPDTEHAWMGVIVIFFKIFRGLAGSGKKFE